MEVLNCKQFIARESVSVLRQLLIQALYKGGLVPTSEVGKRGAEITVREQHPFEILAHGALPGLAQWKQSLLDPLTGSVSSPMKATRKELRRSCSSPRTRQPTSWKRKAPKLAIAGTKRKIEESEKIHLLQSIDIFFPSPISKSFRQSRCQIHDTEMQTWPNDDISEPRDNPENSSEDQCIIRNCSMPMVASDLHIVPRYEVSKSFTSSFLIKVFAKACAVRWYSAKPGRTEEPAIIEADIMEVAPTGWASLPNDLQGNILRRVEFKDLFRFQILSKSCKRYIESDGFREWRGAVSSHGEGSFTAINYCITKNKAWQCCGFDLCSKTWRVLPTFSYLPASDAELFKEYSVCGHGGLLCAEVSKFPKKGELVVFNPLTGKRKELPSLLYTRQPVLVHISVNSAKKSFKVVVAGSSSMSDEHLSKKMEIYDSCTSGWTEMPDLPGPAFGLNEHQTGVCVNGILFFIIFLDSDSRRGVVAFDVDHGAWLQDMACPIPFSSYSNTLQLVESDERVYLFSEQERAASVQHCIDELEIPNPKIGAVSCRWRNVVRETKSGGRGLLVYPEFTCTGFEKGRLCIFNTLSRDGVVYSLQDGKQVELLEPPPANLMDREKFFTLNPAAFTLQPDFASDPNCW